MAIVLFGATIAGAAETVNFDGDFIGTPPKGWAVTMTGKGTPKWTVERDDTAPSKGLVLKQGHLSAGPEGWHERQGRICRSKVQSRCRFGGSRGRPRMASQGCEQLLRRACERT